MAIDPFGLLALFGFTIIVGYIGSLIFSKTGVSDVIWLLLLGIILGPVLNVVEREIFLFISPFLAAVALLIILFDAGLNMNIYRMIHNVPRSLLLSILNVIFSMFAVAGFASVFLGFDFTLGLFLGALVGGTSSPVVIELVSKAKIGERTRTTLTLESVFTDPLVIVISLALINILVQNAQFSAVQSILAAFSIGAVVGVISGILWLFVLQRLKGKPFDYMLTLAALFLIYVFVESNTGSGALASLFFGLMLGNGAAISKMLRISPKEGADPLIRTFQSEVSFFIRSFFFVFLGLITVINPTLAMFGVAIAIALILARLVAVEISSLRMLISPIEHNSMRVMAPRGLAAAVLALFPAAYGIAEAQIISDIVFVVILVTVLYTTFAMKFVSMRYSPRKTKTDEETGKPVEERAKRITKPVKAPIAPAKTTKKRRVTPKPGK